MVLFCLNGVSFKNMINYPKIEIIKGKITFICGISGSGKSTLLKLLNGVLSADRGEILYLNKNIESYNPVALRQEILLVNQSIYLFDETIRENFHNFYDYRNLKMPDDETIRRYLKLCCADFPLDTVCTTMSGGERQRVYIAICLSLMPKVLLLDEPTSALDEHNAYTILENIKGFCKENDITVIAVSHNKALSEHFADEIISL